MGETTLQSFELKTLTVFFSQTATQEELKLQQQDGRNLLFPAVGAWLRTVAGKAWVRQLWYLAEEKEKEKKKRKKKKEGSGEKQEKLRV